MIQIGRVNADEASTVIDLIGKLFDEIRTEADTEQIDRDRIIEQWNESEDKFIVYVAVNEENNPVGAITLNECFALFANGNYGIINELYVVPEERSHKIGHRLVEKAKEYGRRHDWHRIDVTAPPGEKWKRTLDFYKREGFHEAGPKLKFKIA